MADEMKFLAELPAGYDERTCMALTDDNRVIVTHPEHPPRAPSPSTLPEHPPLALSADGQWLDLNKALVHPALGSSNC